MSVAKLLKLIEEANLQVQKLGGLTNSDVLRFSKQALAAGPTAQQLLHMSPGVQHFSPQVLGAGPTFQVFVEDAIQQAQKLGGLTDSEVHRFSKEALEAGPTAEGMLGIVTGPVGSRFGQQVIVAGPTVQQLTRETILQIQRMGAATGATVQRFSKEALEAGPTANQLLGVVTRPVEPRFGRLALLAGPTAEELCREAVLRLQRLGVAPAPIVQSFTTKALAAGPTTKQVLGLHHLGQQQGEAGLTAQGMCMSIRAGVEAEPQVCVLLLGTEALSEHACRHVGN